jgi:hypothetical protein
MFLLLLPGETILLCSFLYTFGHKTREQYIWRFVFRKGLHAAPRLFPCDHHTFSSIRLFRSRSHVRPLQQQICIAATRRI